MDSTHIPSDSKRVETSTYLVGSSLNIDESVVAAALERVLGSLPHLTNHAESLFNGRSQSLTFAPKSSLWPWETVAHDPDQKTVLLNPSAAKTPSRASATDTSGADSSPALTNTSSSNSYVMSAENCEASANVSGSEGTPTISSRGPVKNIHSDFPDVTPQQSTVKCLKASVESELPIGNSINFPEVCSSIDLALEKVNAIVTAVQELDAPSSLTLGTLREEIVPSSNNDIPVEYQAVSIRNTHQDSPQPVPTSPVSDAMEVEEQRPSEKHYMEQAKNIDCVRAITTCLKTPPRPSGLLVDVGENGRGSALLQVATSFCSRDGSVDRIENHESFSVSSAHAGTLFAGSSLSVRDYTPRNSVYAPREWLGMSPNDHSLSQMNNASSSGTHNPGPIAVSGEREGQDTSFEASAQQSGVTLASFRWPQERENEKTNLGDDAEKRGGSPPRNSSMPPSPRRPKHDALPTSSISIPANTFNTKTELCDPSSVYPGGVVDLSCDACCETRRSGTKSAQAACASTESQASKPSRVRRNDPRSSREENRSVSASSARPRWKYISTASSSISNYKPRYVSPLRFAEPWVSGNDKFTFISKKAGDATCGVTTIKTPKRSTSPRTEVRNSPTKNQRMWAGSISALSQTTASSSETKSLTQKKRMDEVDIGEIELLRKERIVHLKTVGTQTISRSEMPEKKRCELFRRLYSIAPGCKIAGPDRNATQKQPPVRHETVSPRVHRDANALSFLKERRVSPLTHAEQVAVQARLYAEPTARKLNFSKEQAEKRKRDEENATKARLKLQEVSPIKSTVYERLCGPDWTHRKLPERSPEQQQSPRRAAECEPRRNRLKCGEVATSGAIYHPLWVQRGKLSRGPIVGRGMGYVRRSSHNPFADLDAIDAVSEHSLTADGSVNSATVSKELEIKGAGGCGKTYGDFERAILSAHDFIRPTDETSLAAGLNIQTKTQMGPCARERRGVRTDGHQSMKRCAVLDSQLNRNRHTNGEKVIMGRGSKSNLPIGLDNGISHFIGEGIVESRTQCEQNQSESTQENHQDKPSNRRESIPSSVSSFNPTFAESEKQSPRNVSSSECGDPATESRAHLHSSCALPFQSPHVPLSATLPGSPGHYENNSETSE